MTIVRADIQTAYRSAQFNDTPSNGGRMTNVAVTSGVVGNLFPDAGSAERAAGSDKFRKVFYKNSNDDDDTLFNGRVFVERYTPGDDELFIFVGTQTDVQSALTGSEPLFGCGQLNADVSGGAGSITVAVHDGATILFRDGDTIRISDKTDIDDVSNNAEFNVVSGTPSVLLDVVTITLTTPLVNSYLAIDTRVASVIDLGDIETAFDSFVVTSGAGTYDEVGSPVEGDNIGTIQQSWTLTFSDATNFTVVGDVVGSVGAGVIGSDFSPVNTDWGVPYFILRSAGWGGTFSNGDTVTFNTSPAAAPIWHERVVPAGAASLTANDAVVSFAGEAA
jgi:hypothetical protein